MTEPAPDSGEVVVAHLADVSLLGRSGALWGFSGDQLNANLVVLRAGDAMPSYTNPDTDVLIIVQLGTGAVMIDGDKHEVRADSVVLVPAGTERQIIAHQQLLYFSIHQRGDGLGLSQRRS